MMQHVIAEWNVPPRNQPRKTMGGNASTTSPPKIHYAIAIPWAHGWSVPQPALIDGTGSNKLKKLLPQQGIADQPQHPLKIQHTHHDVKSKMQGTRITLPPPRNYAESQPPAQSRRAGGRRGVCGGGSRGRARCGGRYPRPHRGDSRRGIATSYPFKRLYRSGPVAQAPWPATWTARHIRRRRHQATPSAVRASQNRSSASCLVLAGERV